MYIFKFFLLLLVSFPLSSLAFRLPAQLNSFDRKEVTRILGLGTSSKFKSHPYSLGGYSGLETGLSIDSIELKGLNLLGDKSTQLDNLYYPRITVGKGLYNNFDIYAHFTPFLKQDIIFEYGGMIRWSFYQAEFHPINFSMTVHGSTVNLSDIFVSSTFGASLIGGLTFGEFSTYLGVGQLTTNSRFAAKDLSVIVSTSGNEEEVSLQSSYSFAGIFYQWSDLFINFEASRYSQPVYSIKLGLKY